MFGLTRYFPRYLPIFIGAFLAAFFFAGCGKEEDVHFAINEGIYVTVGPLKYQVQLSRQLNPLDVEDQSYVKGLPVGQRTLRKNETFFGVFMRVENRHGGTHPSADKFAIIDTDGTLFPAVPLNTAVNPFAYAPAPVGPGGILPNPDSAAGNGPTQGALLLFKLTYAAFQNRPLNLRIQNSKAKGQASVHLDV